MPSTVEQLAQLINVRVVAGDGGAGVADCDATQAAARADLRNREAQLMRAEGVVFGVCDLHPKWRAIRDGGQRPECPFCHAAREAATDLNEYVRRVFA
jgi:hypothetical protein